MPLRRLASLERKKIEDEYREVVAQIKDLEALLRSPKKVRQVASEELLVVKQAFGEARRTRIVQLGKGETRATKLTTTDLVPEHGVWVMVSPTGQLCRTPDEKIPRLSGDDTTSELVLANSRDTVYLVATNGETAAIPVHTLPEAVKPSDGVPFRKASALSDGHELAGAFSLPGKGDRAEDSYLITITRQGMVKKSALSELPGPAAQAFTLMRVNAGDRLGCIRLTNGKADLLLVSSSGAAIRFNEEEIRPMGLVAGGVMGIKLAEQDQVVGAEVMPGRGEVLLVASDATAKRVAVDQFPRQARYGQGVIAWKLPGGVHVAGIAVGRTSSRVILRLAIGAPRPVRFEESPLQGRPARGRRLFELKPKEEITGLVTPRETDRSLNGKVTIDGKLGSRPARNRSLTPAKVSTGEKPRPTTNRSRKASAEKAADKEKPAPRAIRTAAAGPAKASPTPSAEKPPAQKPVKGKASVTTKTTGSRQSTAKAPPSRRSGSSRSSGTAEPAAKTPRGGGTGKSKPASSKKPASPKPAAQAPRNRGSGSAKTYEGGRTPPQGNRSNRSRSSKTER
jgi:DNA gyrase subunit A